MPYLTSFCFVEFRLLYQFLSFVIFSFTRQHLLCAMKEKQIITMFLPHSFLNIKNKPCPMCELEQDFAEISVSEYTYLYIHYILIFALCYMVFFTKNRIDFCIFRMIDMFLKLYSSTATIFYHQSKSWMYPKILIIYVF